MAGDIGPDLKAATKLVWIGEQLAAGASRNGLEPIVEALPPDWKALAKQAIALASNGSFLELVEAQVRGNTLSPVIRQAWDSGDLRSLTKNSPARATGAHISIMGHITLEELRRYLNKTEAGNGFANRFLWLFVKRSQCLPEGGNLQSVDLAPTRRRIQEAITFARRIGEIRRDEGARALWRETYGSLSQGRPGLLGAVTSRAEAQVMRLACLYALTDCSASIQREHTEAALALWAYCDDSARFIFGDALGDPIADQIMQVLRGSADGKTRTEINNLFNRNVEAGRIVGALRILQEQGLAFCKKEETPGRSAERWFLNARPSNEDR